MDMICLFLALLGAPILVLYLLIRGREKDKKEQAVRREKFLNTPVDIHKCAVRIYTYDGALFNREFIGELHKRYNLIDMFGEGVARQRIFHIKDFIEVAENRFYNVSRIKSIEWDILPHFVTPKDVL